jgi:beta-lactamase regulating signal transducer with metallopeptidase domain
MINAILLDGLWLGAIVTAIAALITTLVPQRHAATRYAVWFAALLALAILPVASLWHPAPLTSLPDGMERTAAATTIVMTRAASASGLWLLGIWLGGVAFCLFRLGLSYARIARIVRDATPLPELGTGVVTSDDVAFPIAAGLFAPVVVIPRTVVATLERGDLESIVRHEQAHIRRMDIAGNLVQRIVEACLFFNPWVYVIGRQLIREREAACDDWAVHASGAPDRYASCLAQLARGTQHARTPLLTPSAIGSRRMLVGRIARLLNGKVTQLKINYLVLGTSVAAFGLLAILLQTSTGLASNAPQLGSTAVVASSQCVPVTIPKDADKLSPAEQKQILAQLKATSSDVKVVNAVPPDISKADYRPNVQANAVVTVGADGTPQKAKISLSSGSAAIDQATIKAAMASTYSPAMSNCKPRVDQYLFHVATGGPQ